MMRFSKDVKPLLQWIPFGVVGLVLAIGFGNLAAYFPAYVVLAAVIGCASVAAIALHPVAGMYILAFFLPFERIGSVDIAGVTIRISQVVALLTISAWVVRGFYKGTFKMRPYPPLFPILGFLAVAIFSTINAPFLERSWTVLLFIIFTISISIILPSIIRHTYQVEWIVWILLVSLAVVGLFGLYQFLGDIVGLPITLTGLRQQYTKEILGFPRIQSTALEPLYFANYLLIPLSIAIATWLSKTSKIKSWQLLSLIALGGINLVLTVARGGYIAFAASVLVLAIAFWRQLFRPKIIITGLIALTVIGGVAYRFLNLTDELGSFTEHVTDLFGGASYEERVQTIDIAETIWLQHPWIGIGPGSFGPYASFHPLLVPKEGYKIVNNEYIELLAETGVLGLGCFLLLILILYIRSFKALRAGNNPYLKAVLIGLVAAFTGTLVQYNTFSVLYIMHIWFTIGLMVAIQNILLHGDYQ